MKIKLFTGILVVLLAVFSVIIWGVAKQFLDQGKDLNRTAWEASYTERNMKVPESGPRDGYWGSRRGNAVEDRNTVWHDAEVLVEGLLDVDANGYQYSFSSESDCHRIVILGASVASGAYASSIKHTYFNVIESELELRGIPTDISVIASGAWKSKQEVAALEQYLKDENPDLVVFLDGFNDLTGGASARHLYGEPFQSPNGEIVDPLYHSHDYQQRVATYLDNMAVAREIISAYGSRMLVVLQPSLTERSHRTPIEEKVLKSSLVPHTSLEALTTSYDAIRSELLRRADAGSIFFLDGSRIFDKERETTFADLWHFSDVGHKMLGAVMADEISRILKKKSQHAVIQGN